MRQTAKEEKLMIKNKPLGLTLLLVLALVAFFATGGNAAETKQKLKASNSEGRM
jgi:hypothetical protein